MSKMKDPDTAIEEAMAFFSAKAETRWLAAHISRHTTSGLPEFKQDCKTAHTTGKRIVVGPWWTYLPLRQRVFVLAHEALHCMFEHPRRGKLYREAGIGPDLQSYEHGRMNRASDYLINDTLISDMGFRHDDMPKGTLYDTSYTARTQSEDTIYCQLPSEPEDDEENWDDHDQECEEDPGDSDDDPPTDPQEIAAIIDAQVKANMLDALSVGSLPGGIARRLQGHYTPRVDWRSQFADLLEQSSGNTEASWARPHRRRIAIPPHPYLPSKRGLSLGVVAICVDVSGSISGVEFTAFIGEVTQILQDYTPSELHLITWDTAAEYRQIDDTSDMETITPSGGGGTDYGVALRQLMLEGIEPDLIINMTDGYVDFPQQPNTTHITLTTAEPCPWGANIKIDLYDLITRK